MYDTWINAAGLALGVLTAMGAIMMWLNGKFNLMSNEFSNKVEIAVDKVMQKFEKHVEEDNRKFDQVRGEIFEMKLIDATRNGAMLRTQAVDQETKKTGRSKS